MTTSKGQVNEGPLAGFRIIEIAGLGPAPYAAMLLGDMGAEVIRIERPGGGLFSYPGKLDLLNRNKKCICVDLKKPEALDVVKKLVANADGFMEGMRPGVIEQLGLGPDQMLAVNPKLVYGRMTGWGQDGPLSQTAGHDINYIALTGALHAIGNEGERPTVPLALAGDFGGGGVFMAFAICCALLETSRSGKGQVIDAAIIDGTSHLMSVFYAAQQVGFWKPQRGTNLLDGGAPFYGTYQCSDGEYIALGAIEKKFYDELIKGLGLVGEELPEQMDQEKWPELSKKFKTIIAGKSRAQWMQIFEKSNACVSPVLSMDEARQHPHNVHRETFIDDGEVWQPRPTPRFSRTDNSGIADPADIGQHTEELLHSIGYTDEKIDALKQSGTVIQSEKQDT